LDPLQILTTVNQRDDVHLRIIVLCMAT